MPRSPTWRAHRLAPERLVLVTATATDIGKTWVAARLLEHLRQAGHQVEARKAVQSFEPGSGQTDAEVLAAAAGCTPDRVCPPHRSYPLPLAPPIAGERLGRDSFTLADLVAEMDLPGRGITVVEGAGGWRSPLAADGDTRALARLIQPDLVVLVAGAELGAIHAVRSCLDTMDGCPATVFLNRYVASQIVAASNLAWLRDRDEFDVVTEIETLAARIAG